MPRRTIADYRPLAMSIPERRPPSLTPSFPLSWMETSRVITSVASVDRHLGWHSRGYLLHWDHPGMIQSVNFRLGDALPGRVIARWRSELGVVPGSAAVSAAHSKEVLPPDASAPRAVELRRRIEEYLDAGHGSCWLQQPEIARLVEGALLHFDPQRYRLLAWCVMPNHVHALIETKEGFPLDGLLHSWKSFTSKKANALLSRSGEFWQREYLDRYVRHAEHYQAVLAYIEDNPVKANLVRLRTEWPWSSARFRSRSGSAGLPPASLV